LLDTLGERQQQLLTLLLQQKAGLTVDELAQAMAVTRTAVNQHLHALERDGYVAKAALQRTKGRPGRTYVLTEQGNALFPKQYSWLSGLLLATLKEELGSEGVARYLRKIAARLAGADAQQRVAIVVDIMNELAYEARDASNDGPVIEAKNCVYHELARGTPRYASSIWPCCPASWVSQSSTRRAWCVAERPAVFVSRARAPHDPSFAGRSACSQVE
jgi:DeoR family suf operon transcriptional repressor